MAENATHVVLSQDELARFAEDRLIVVDNVFTRDEVEILRQACRAPEDQPWAQSERLIHSLELTVRHEAFLNWRGTRASSRACQAEGRRDQHPSRSGAAPLRLQFQRRPTARHCLPVPGRRRVSTGRRSLERYRDHDLWAAARTRPLRRGRVALAPNRGAISSTLWGQAWHQEGDFATEVNRRNGLQWIKEEGS
jgi:hypothetical protein